MNDDSSIFEQRKAAAIAQGWECWDEDGIWCVESCSYSDSGDEYTYSWVAQTEYSVWWELLMDGEIYDELTKLLGVG